MRNDYDYQDISRMIIEARRARDEAAGEMLAETGHALARQAARFAHWLGDKADRFLHAFLMSPTH